RATARPRPAGRDDAKRGRLGDAAPDARAARRGLDPGRDVQRQGRPAGGRPGGRARRSGFHRQAVRPERADRADETAPADLIRLDHHLQRWVVHHRVGWLNPLVVDFTRIATDGLLFVLVGVVLAVLWGGPGSWSCWWRQTSLRTGSRSSCGSGSAGCARRSSIPTRGRSWPRRIPARFPPATRRAPSPARP